MKFKIGDKVIIVVCDRACKMYKNEIGEITTVDRIKKGFSNRWDYDVTFNDGFTYPFNPGEIKKAVAKNQQLLFEFMR